LSVETTSDSPVILMRYRTAGFGFLAGITARWIRFPRLSSPLLFISDLRFLEPCRGLSLSSSNRQMRLSHDSESPLCLSENRWAFCLLFVYHSASSRHRGIAIRFFIIFCPCEELLQFKRSCAGPQNLNACCRFKQSKSKPGTLR
jgi:hypothetical protein